MSFSALPSSPASTQPFIKEQQPASRPIWRETFVGLDWLALHASPVFYGLGVPRGDGSPVIVIPGFLGTDFYLTELHGWLRRIGYRPYFSGIGRNADCMETLVSRLMRTVERAQAETKRAVHLIGHSLGGVLARSAAGRAPERIASVITLGSPFRGIRSHPFVLETANIVRQTVLGATDQAENPKCMTSYCDCTAVCDLQDGFPPCVRQTAVYTRTDGIVDWRVCSNGDAATDVEVQGTHVGLVFNAEVYSVIAHRLAPTATT